MVENNKQFKRIQQNIIVPDSLSGTRLDQILSQLLPEYSRSILQKWLKEGNILIDNQQLKPKQKLLGGEEIQIDVTILPINSNWQPQEMPLDIVFEDDDILVINKPYGLVVHPGAGNIDQTLSNALLAHSENFSQVPRAGIVHRLDKDTSGLMVCAKSLEAHNSLVQQLQERTVKREYEAIACGLIAAGETIKTNIGRHPHNRLKMAVIKEGGKPAITHFNVVERYRAHSRIRCQLETGRTHQIRVHLQHKNYPLLGDPLYNPRLQLPKGICNDLSDALKDFKRQALHAYHLSFIHPISKKQVSFKQKPPEDVLNLIELLRKDYQILAQNYYDTLNQWQDFEDDWDDEFEDDSDFYDDNDEK